MDNATAEGLGHVANFVTVALLNLSIASKTKVRSEGVNTRMHSAQRLKPRAYNGIGWIISFWPHCLLLLKSRVRGGLLRSTPFIDDCLKSRQRGREHRPACSFRGILRSLVITIRCGCLSGT